MYDRGPWRRDARFFSLLAPSTTNRCTLHTPGCGNDAGELPLLGPDSSGQYECHGLRYFHLPGLVALWWFRRHHARRNRRTFLRSASQQGPADQQENPHRIFQLGDDALLDVADRTDCVDLFWTDRRA